MNYVWEVLLAADSKNIEEQELRFLPAVNASPYVEVSFTDLNTVSVEDRETEINPLYRFTGIFSDLLNPDIRVYRDTGYIFFDVVMHYMAETDLLSGMHRQEFYFWFLAEEMRKGFFGERTAEAFSLFDVREQRLIVTSLLGLYRSAHYKALFTGLIRELYENAIVYEGRDRAETIFLYVGRKETDAERKRVHFLADTFLPINENVAIFYDEHFGVTDVEETMKMDRILLI